MFDFVKNDNGLAFPIQEAKKAAIGTYKVGDALVHDSTTGNVKAATGTTVPDYIGAEEVVLTSVSPIAVMKITDGQVWKTQFSADASAVKDGAKVTLDSDGRKVTATTTDGVATIDSRVGTGVAGNTAFVRF